MMRELLHGVAQGLPQSGPVLVLGDPSLAAELQSVAPHPIRVISVDDEKNSSRADGPGRRRPTLRAEPVRLPAADGSLAAIVSLNLMSGFSEPERVLESWKAALRVGGTLVLAERVPPSGPWRALQRLIAPPKFHPAPETLTALLSNAGFARITQVWPPARLRTIVTIGTLKVR